MKFMTNTSGENAKTTQFSISMRIEDEFFSFVFVFVLFCLFVCLFVGFVFFLFLFCFVLFFVCFCFAHLRWYHIAM